MINKGKQTDKRSEKPVEWIVKESTELLAYLFEMLSKRGRNSVKAILARGQVTVNGKVWTKHNHLLQIGDRVSIIKNIRTNETKLDGIGIIHEDDDIIIIEKEAGLLTIATDKEQLHTAYRELMKYVRNENEKNRIFIVHRLDRDTSGIMMFAKSKEIQQALQTNWHETVPERSYIALVEGVVPKDGTVTSWLRESKSFKMHSSQNPNDGQKAITHYNVIKTSPKATLLNVNLETGRKNQIRVHLQDIGHPIIGDKKYGSTTNPIRRLALHAQILAFKHPRTGEQLRFETKIPTLFLRAFK